MAVKQETESIDIQVTASGSKESVLEAALKQLAPLRQELVFDATGTKPSVANTFYDVVFTLPQAAEAPVAEGKEGEVSKPVMRLGKSTASFDEAYKQATDDGKLSPQGDISLTVKEVFEVPFMYVEITGTAVSEKALYEMLAQQETDLRQRFGGRMQKQPASVYFKATRYSGAYSKKDNKHEGHVVCSGESNSSVGHAMQNAKEETGGKKVQSTSFEGKHLYKVFEMTDDDAKAAVEPKQKALIVLPDRNIVTPGTLERRVHAHQPSVYRSGGGSSYTPSAAPVTDLV